MKLKQRLKNTPQSSEAGYTIIEGLVAMIMVAALMVAVAPVIAFSVGTRVQARRVELAAQAARSYMDGVRTGVIEAPGLLGQNPDVTDAPAGGSLTCTDDEDYCTDDLGGRGQLYCVDGGDDGGCTTDSAADMVIQVGRFNSSNPTDPTAGYQLMVRVYKAMAFQDSDALSKESAGTTVTNALGNLKAPMFTTVTEVGPTSGNSYQDLRDRLD